MSKGLYSLTYTKYQNETIVFALLRTKPFSVPINRKFKLALNKSSPKWRAGEGL